MKETGVFVTINSASDGPEKLRGCIGYPYPVMRLGEAITSASVSAATEDPRFRPVSTRELGSVLFEVSVLSPPAKLASAKRTDFPSKVRVGVDGLMVSRGHYSGLLLPQVATEFGMDATEFLSQACTKAGLPPDSWLDPETEVQIFQAQIFAEATPGGPVREVKQRAS